MGGFLSCDNQSRKSNQNEHASDEISPKKSPETSVDIASKKRKIRRLSRKQWREISGIRDKHRNVYDAL